ncbi:hypothetical protein ACLOJK_016869 [Asimina triloba]
MAPVISSAAKQAELLKQDGNTFFTKNRFGAAIDAYTEAITLCPNVPVYWTNRALCYRKKNDWTKVEDDCRKALQLDSTSVKGRDRGYVEERLCSIHAHYMLGLALLERQEYAEGVKELEKALDLGRGANCNSYMVEEIWQELAKAKYLEWESDSSKRQWKLQTLKEACEAALAEKHFLDSSQPDDGSNGASDAHVEQLSTLEQVFETAAEADTPTEVPDYLCCKITLDIFRDPVITPSGVSYERAVIIEHLQKVIYWFSGVLCLISLSIISSALMNKGRMLEIPYSMENNPVIPGFWSLIKMSPGHPGLCGELGTLNYEPRAYKITWQIVSVEVGKFDPITREPLDPRQLISNLAIKEAVQAFLNKHGWAYKVS